MQKLRKRAVRLDDPTKEAATRSRLRTHRVDIAALGDLGPRAPASKRTDLRKRQSQSAPRCTATRATSVAARESTSSGRSGKAAANAAANPFPSRRGSSSRGARRCWIAGGSRSEPERLPRAGLAIPGEAGHETRCVGGAYTEPPDGGRVMRLRAPLCSGARNGQAFGLAKHLTNPADRSGSGQESRQPSQRCEQSMNKYNETRSSQARSLR